MNYNNSRQNQQAYGFSSAGRISLDPYTQQILQQNQAQFQLALAQRQKNQQSQQEYFSRLMENQNRIMQGLVYQHASYHPQYYQPPPPPPQPNKKFQVNLKSIMLKPLEYYSQQMNNVQFQQPYQQALNQQQLQQQQQIQSQMQMQRPHGFKETKPAQQSIEIQTDDDITQFEKYQRMGMANTIADNIHDEGWAPDQDGQMQQQGFEDNPNYEKGQDWNFKQQQKLGQMQQSGLPVEQKRVKFKPLPPGMNKEQQQRAKRNLKVFKLALIYLLFYWIEIDKSNRARRQEALEIKGANAIKCLQAFLEYFKKTLPKVILAFAENKADMFISDKKKILEDEKTSCTFISQFHKMQVRKFIIALIETFNPKEIPDEQIAFLGSIMHDYEYLPQNFLFNFELNRLEYTTFGALKFLNAIIIQRNMTSTRGQMLILTMLVIRVYVFRMILKPWVDFGTIKKKELLTQNCYVVGSVIYEITMDYIKDRCFKIGQNQAHLAMEKKTLPRPYGPLTVDRYQLPEDPAEVRVIRQQEEPVIMGLEERVDLKSILDDDKKFIQEMQDYLEEFADSIYDLIHTKYVIKKADERKVHLDKKIKFIDKQFKDNPNEQFEAVSLAKKIASDYEARKKI